MERSIGKRITHISLIVCVCILSMWCTAAHSDPFIGEIRMFAGTFAPRGWAFCDGQLLLISQNQSLFSILGTTYGGDGRTSFGLPDLRGRFPLHPGTGAGLTQRRLGEKSGTETVTLSTSQVPSHNHGVTAQVAIPVQSTEGDSASPAGNIPAKSGDGRPDYSTGPSDDTMPAVNAGVIQNNVGGGQAHNNMPPYQGVHFIICLQGLYPSRS